MFLVSPKSVETHPTKNIENIPDFETCDVWIRPNAAALRGQFSRGKSWPKVDVWEAAKAFDMPVMWLYQDIYYVYPPWN